MSLLWAEGGVVVSFHPPNGIKWLLGLTLFTFPPVDELIFVIVVPSGTVVDLTGGTVDLDAAAAATAFVRMETPLII